jgi:hypothetical protein
MTQEETLPLSIAGFLKDLNRNGSYGRMSPVFSVQIREGTLAPSSGRWLNSGMGSPTECWTLKTSESPNVAVVFLLSDVLETGDVPQKFYLSPKACEGVLRRAEKRGKALPPQLKSALEKTEARTI